MATTSPVFSTRAASWATAAVLLLLMMMITGPAHAQDRGELEEEKLVESVCPATCYEAQCMRKADLGKLYPGLLRSAEEVSKDDLPEGCSVTFEEDEAKVSCNDKAEAKYVEEYRTFCWLDGNCCCPAHRYLVCPVYAIADNGNEYKVVRGQCYTQVYCGRETGFCQGKCVPIYHRQTLLVYDNCSGFHFCFLRWVNIKVVAACRCTTCEGERCKHW